MTHNETLRIMEIVIVGLAAFILAFLLVGCGDSPRPLPPADGVAPGGVVGTLERIGIALTWAGAIAVAAGVGLSLVSLVVPVLSPFAALFRFAAIGGIGITGTGVSVLWLADNLWLLAICIVASLGVVAWWYWPALARSWHRRVGAPEVNSRVG